MDQQSSQEVNTYILAERLNRTLDSDCIEAITNFICASNFPQCVSEGVDNAPCTQLDDNINQLCPFNVTTVFSSSKNTCTCYDCETTPGGTNSGTSEGGTPSPTASLPNEQCYTAAENLDFCGKITYKTTVPTNLQAQMDQQSSQDVDTYILAERLNVTHDADCIDAITNFICSSNFPKCVSGGADNAPCTRLDNMINQECPFSVTPALSSTKKTCTCYNCPPLDNGLSTFATVAIVLGVIVIVGGAGITLFYLFYWRKKRQYYTRV